MRSGHRENSHSQRFRTIALVVMRKPPRETEKCFTWKGVPKIWRSHRSINSWILSHSTLLVHLILFSSTSSDRQTQSSHVSFRFSSNTSAHSFYTCMALMLNLSLLISHVNRIRQLLITCESHSFTFSACVNAYTLKAARKKKETRDCKRAGNIV